MWLASISFRVSAYPHLHTLRVSVVRAHRPKIGSLNTASIVSRIPTLLFIVVGHSTKLENCLINLALNCIRLSELMVSANASNS